MIKKIKICPDWFDIDNYNICTSFTRYSWEYALLFRRFTIQFVSNRNSNQNQYEVEYYKKQIKQYASKEFLLEASSMKCEDSCHSFLEKEESISNISYCDLLTMYENLQYHDNKSIHYMSEIIKNRDKCYKMFKKEEEKLGIFDEHPFWGDYLSEDILPDNWSVFAEIPLYEDSEAFARVNLRNNDEDIINSFKEWLQKTRAIRGQKKTNKMSDNELNRLAQFKVLPYIDLYLWAELTGEKLTLYQMASLLYPDEYEIDIKERLRSCTIPRAKALINSFIRVFR